MARFWCDRRRYFSGIGDNEGGELPFAADGNPNLNDTGADIHDPASHTNQRHRLRLVFERGRHKLWQLKTKKFSTVFSTQTSWSLRASAADDRGTMRFVE